MGIKQRIFSQPFDNVTFYVNSFSSRENRMKDVFVVDRRDDEMTYTIVAQEGMISPIEGKKMINLHFLNGTIFMVDKNLASARSIRFSTYDLNIGLKDIMAALARRQKGPKELGMGELISQIKALDKGTGLNEAMIVFFEKISMPIAVFFMGLLGLPLGARLRSSGLSTGIGVSLAVFMLYYFCLAGARSICETGLVNPVIGVFMPDIFLAAAFFVLIRRAEREHSINIFEALLMRLKRK
jgi:lipopolysaccharide export system permease protein